MFYLCDHPPLAFPSPPFYIIPIHDFIYIFLFVFYLSRCKMENSEMTTYSCIVSSGMLSGSRILERSVNGAGLVEQSILLPLRLTAAGERLGPPPPGSPTGSGSSGKVSSPPVPEDGPSPGAFFVVHVQPGGHALTPLVTQRITRRPILNSSVIPLCSGHAMFSKRSKGCLAGNFSVRVPI